jgi:DNA helicase IV
MASQSESAAPVVYWHRQLPPLRAEPVAEHTVEATSDRILGTIAHRDELWDQCYESLMTHARQRIEQEVARLGGQFAHVLDEAVESKHNDITDEAWLRGVFTYMLYRLPDPG